MGMSKTVPMSTFIQSYTKHLSEAEYSDDTIVLQQRGGRPTWVMETEHRVQDTEEATYFLSAALGALLKDPELFERFPAALMSTLPWVSFLPEEDQATFAQEATESLKACASLGRYTAFARLVEDWRNTAEIWSDPDLAESLGYAVDEPINTPVEDQ